MSAPVSVADRVAVVALCTAVLRRPGGPSPIGPSAWARIDVGLTRAGLRPADLFEMPPTRIAEELGLTRDAAARVADLLSAAGPVAMEIERLADRGIWPLCIVEPEYPARLRQALGHGAPPVLFGSGERSLCGLGGVAIVGSRKAGADAVAFAEDLARAVARNGSCVVSGGAAGVDAAAMGAALAEGGPVVGVPSDHLERRIREPSVREALAGGRLALLTPYSPDLSFSVRTAMGRNKVVYGLAEVAVVVATASGEGGTWTGAVETLQRGTPPVLVRQIHGDPGSGRLVELGAAPLPFDTVPEAIGAGELLGSARPRSREEQATIFGEAEPLRQARTRRGKPPSDPHAAPPAAVRPEAAAEPGRAATMEAAAGEGSADPATPFQETGPERAVEVVRALAVGAVGSVPVVGPVLGALVGVAWPEIKAQRLERFAAELDVAVSAMGDRLDRDFVTRAEFRDLAEEVLDEVAQRRNDEKLAEFAAALAASASAARPEAALRERMLDALSALRPRHLRLLSALAQPEADWVRPGDVFTVGQVVQSRIAQATGGSAFDESDWADLERLGLLRSTGDIGTMLASAADVRALVSPYGREFLEFVGMERARESGPNTRRGA